METFAAKKKEFLDDLVTTVEMEEIPPELILIGIRQEFDLCH